LAWKKVAFILTAVARGFVLAACKDASEGFACLTNLGGAGQFEEVEAAYDFLHPLLLPHLAKSIQLLSKFRALRLLLKIKQINFDDEEFNKAAFSILHTTGPTKKHLIRLCFLHHRENWLFELLYRIIVFLLHRLLEEKFTLKNIE